MIRTRFTEMFGVQHPIVQGCEDVWGPSDVYTVTALPATAKPLIFGQVLEGMKPADKPVEGDYVVERQGRKLTKRPNDPMMPVAWTNSFTGRSGKSARVFTTTMGAASDLVNEGLRRLIVNGVYWSLGMEEDCEARQGRPDRRFPANIFRIWEIPARPEAFRFFLILLHGLFPLTSCYIHVLFGNLV